MNGKSMCHYVVISTFLSTPQLKLPTVQFHFKASLSPPCPLYAVWGEADVYAREGHQVCPHARGFFTPTHRWCPELFRLPSICPVPVDTISQEHLFSHLAHTFYTHGSLGSFHTWQHWNNYFIQLLQPSLFIPTIHSPSASVCLCVSKCASLWRYHKVSIFTPCSYSAHVLGLCVCNYRPALSLQQVQCVTSERCYVSTLTIKAWLGAGESHGALYIAWSLNQ